MARKNEIVGDYRLYHLIRAGALYEIWAVRAMSGSDAVRHQVAAEGQPEVQLAPRFVKELKHEYTVGKALDHPSVHHHVRLRLGEERRVAPHGVLQDAQPQAADHGRREARCSGG